MNLKLISLSLAFAASLSAHCLSKVSFSWRRFLPRALLSQPRSQNCKFSLEQPFPRTPAVPNFAVSPLQIWFVCLFFFLKKLDT